MALEVQVWALCCGHIRPVSAAARKPGSLLHSPESQQSGMAQLWLVILLVVSGRRASGSRVGSGGRRWSDGLLRGSAGRCRRGVGALPVVRAGRGGRCWAENACRWGGLYMGPGWAITRTLFRETSFLGRAEIARVFALTRIVKPYADPTLTLVCALISSLSIDQDRTKHMLSIPSPRN